MKTTTKVAFSAALILGALTSCDKENGFFGRIGSSTIGISSVKAEAPATKAVTEETSQVTLEDGSVFTIHKTIEPYTTGPQTKAVIKKAEDINSFTLYGYLDEAELAKAEGASQTDKEHPNFIAGAGVTKDGSAWHIDRDNYWRNGITHYFWAQSGLDKMETTANSASFTKAANSDEDILVAYASKKWYEHSGSDHSSDNLDINFKHALSAVKVKRGTITYQQHDTTAAKKGTDEEYTPLPADQIEKKRIILNKINLLRLTEGHCSVSSGMDIKWDNLTKNAVEEIKNEDETILSIPQNTSVLEVYYTDTYRTMTRPAIITLNDSWKAGELYNYTLNGTVTVPKLEGNPQQNEGIDLNFKGKEKRSQIVLTTLNVRYYKKIKISWTSLPKTTGNGTYGFAYYGNDLNVESVTDIDSFIKKEEVFFAFNAFKEGECLKGNVEFSPDKERAKAVCSCEISFPDDVKDNVNLYFAYIGGTGSTDKTNWIIKNMKIEVIEYR